MDKAFLSLKSKGIVLDDKLYRSKANATTRVSGSVLGPHEANKKSKIMEEARLYKEISNTFQLLHSN